MKITEKEIEIPLDKINIDLEDFNDYIDPSQLILEESELKELVKIAQDYINPRGGFVLYNNLFFDEKSKMLIIENTTLNINTKIFKLLKKSEIISIIICTAGEQISELAKQFQFKGDLLKSYIIDLVGTMTVEKVAEYVHSFLKRNYNKNITNRYSPGYCGWSTYDQYNIFKLIPENFCGVKLNEHGLMLPIKSVSAVVGIGDNVIFKSYNCNICKDKNCIYRKK